MAAFPLTLLALAAGAFLLLKAKKDLMGKLFEGLAWLIIVLSILYMIMLGGRGWMHHRMEGHMMMMREHGQMYGGPMGWHGQQPNCCSMGQGMNSCGEGMNCCSNMNMGGSCSEGRSMSCGNMGMMGHEKGVCCMGDSAKGKGDKAACCMDKKDEAAKPKAGK